MATMDKFIPNFSASEVQEQQQMLTRWANRLTSNNKLLIARLAELQTQLDSLQSRLATIEEELNGINSGND